MKTGLRIFGGLYAGLLVLVCVLCFVFGVIMLSKCETEVTISSWDDVIVAGLDGGFRIFFGVLFMIVGMAAFCFVAPFLPLYILDVKGKGTRVYNIVLICAVLVAVITLAVMDKKQGDGPVLVYFILPAVPMVLYNLLSLARGFALAKKRALMVPEEGEMIEQIPADGDED